MKKILIIHVSILVVIVAILTGVYLRFWNVATVNGTGISRIEYIKNMEKQGGEQTLAFMVDEALILNEGKKNNVSVDQKTIDSEIAIIEEQIKAQGQSLDAALVAAGMVRADLEKQVRIKKIESILSAPKTEITQAQIDNFIKTYKDQLPAKATKTELETIAKDELTAQAKNTAATEWLNGLTKNAKIVNY